MKAFDFDDYRKFVLSALDSRPGGGRGELTKIAQLLGVNSSFLTQVLRGPKNFSQEQAFLLAGYLGLDELETRYLSDLVSFERASKAPYKDFLRRRLEKLRNEARWKAGVPPIDQPLDERSQTIFYSSWQYSAVQLVSGMLEFQTPQAIAKRLKMDDQTVRGVLSFLVSCGLCVTDGERYGVGTRRTHLPDGSPLRPRHHLNWRLKAMDQMPKASAEDLFFTGPMRIDEATFAKIRKILENAVKGANALVDSANDETLACLNVDWFRF